MVSNRLTRRLASAAVLVVAAVLPAALAHSVDVADSTVTQPPAAIVTPSIAVVRLTSPAPYDPMIPSKSGVPTSAVATPTVAPPTVAPPTEAAKAATAVPQAPSSKTSVAAKTVATTKTTVRAATPKPAATAPMATAPAATAPAAMSGSVTPRQDLATAVAAATNAQRTAAGLKALTIKTCSVPASFAVKLATEGGLYHNNLMTVLSGCGGGTTAGENIARGYSSVSGVTAGWMGSAGHRANILNVNYTSIFVGVAQASNGTYYWVENFTG